MLFFRSVLNFFELHLSKKKNQSGDFNHGGGVHRVKKGEGLRRGFLIKVHIKLSEKLVFEQIFGF